MAQIWHVCSTCGRNRTEKNMEQASYAAPKRTVRMRGADVEVDDPFAMGTPSGQWRCMARTSCESWARTAHRVSKETEAAQA